MTGISSAMRILAASYGNLEQEIGAKVVARNLIREWSKSNQVVILEQNAGKIGHPEDRSLRLRTTNYFLWLFESVLRVGLINRCDVIFDSAYYIPFILFARLIRKPVVLLVHDNGRTENAIEHGSAVRGVRTFATQLVAMRTASAVITVSESSRTRLRSYGCDSKTYVIPDGVDLGRFARCSHNHSRNKYFLFVGNTKGQYERKGIRVLLEAFAKLHSEFPSVALVMVGDSDQRLDTDVKRFGLGSKVVITGLVTREQLSEWYNDSIALVLPSLFEGYGLTVNEAMACGTPVIVASSVGAAAIVARAKAGQVFPSGDSASLSVCMKNAIVKKDLAIVWGRNGRDVATNELDWGVVSQRYISLFETIVKANR
jgi:glycosyltransferase involved in cell wall biosynthesis